MTRKTSICYTALFNFIENNVFKLEPMEIMTDFEEGMRKSIKIVYPNAVLRGCWFHYIRAIQRKCMKLGMFKLLQRNSHAKLIKKQITNLPLLPTDKIEEGYCEIVGKEKETFASI